MRAVEFLTEQKSISQYTDDGSLEGYVVSSDKPNISNYLEGQGATPDLIKNILTKYSVIGLIRNMYVDDEARGQGVGSELVGNAIDSAASSGAKAILLVSDTGEDNQFDLTKWYEDFGFEQVGIAGKDPVMILEL